MSTEDRKTLTVFTLMDEHVEVHGFLYSVRINGEVVDVKKKTSVLSRGPLKPKPYSGVPSPLLQHRMSHIELGFTFLLLLPRISLLFLLILLLELLDGIHLIPGAHLAHGGRVLALHHQLVGHLVFLRTKQTGEMETKSLLCWIKRVKMKPLWVQRLQNPSSSTSKVSN